MTESIETGVVATEPLQEHVRVPITHCALARGIDEVGDGWTLLILREVVCGATRFGAMQDELGISRAVLAKRLSRLVERNILVRRPVREPGRRRQHTYQLSEKGQALLTTLIALRQWSEQFVPGPPSPLRLRTRKGEDIMVRLTTTRGRLVDPGEIEASVKE